MFFLNMFIFLVKGVNLICVEKVLLEKIRILET